MSQQIVPALQAISLYQLKITLLDTRPPIWRRIQVKDGTVDKLHEHIQTAMGWTNSHLHHFSGSTASIMGRPDAAQDDVQGLDPHESERNQDR